MSPVPVSVPDPKLKMLRALKSLGPFTVSVPEARENVCVPLLALSCTLPTVAFALIVTVYVPFAFMMALSPLPGTWFGLQFAAVAQFPPAVLVQTMSAACT